MSFEQRQAVDFHQTAEQRRSTLSKRGRSNVKTVLKPRRISAYLTLRTGILILLIPIYGLAIQRLAVCVRIIPGHVNNINANMMETFRKQRQV